MFAESIRVAGADMRKPIICVEGQANGFKYKYKRTGYAVGVPIIFETDLEEEQFARLLDVGMTDAEIDKLETTGKF